MAGLDTKVWLQKDMLSIVPLSIAKQAIRLHGDKIYSFVVPEVECSGLRSKLNAAGVLAKIVYVSPEDVRDQVSGILAQIRGRNHSIYSDGLVFTTYDAEDVEFHLKTKTLTQSRGAERIEVGEPGGGWHNLDWFVEEAFTQYASQGRTCMEREKHLVFYALPETLAKQQALANGTTL
jgi:hypothetical protein